MISINVFRSTVACTGAHTATFAPSWIITRHGVQQVLKTCEFTKPWNVAKLLYQLLEDRLCTADAEQIRIYTVHLSIKIL